MSCTKSRLFTAAGESQTGNPATGLECVHSGHSARDGPARDGRKARSRPLLCGVSANKTPMRPNFIKATGAGGRIHWPVRGFAITNGTQAVNRMAELQAAVHALEARIGALADFPVLQHRLRRSTSWLKRAGSEKDIDTKFILLWVAFNASYAIERNAARQEWEAIRRSGSFKSAISKK